MPSDVGGALFELVVLLIGLGFGAFMVVGLLGMLMNKELSFGEFLVWVGAFVGLLATTIASIGKPLFPLLVCLTIMLGLGAQLSSWIAEMIGLQRLRLADIERFLGGVEKHPNMPYNYVKLAELYYAGGQWEQAIEWYEKAQKIRADPHVVFWLNKARERRELGLGRAVQCRCGKLNPAGAYHCMYCGRVLPGSHRLLAAVGKGYGRLVLLLVAAALLGAGMVTSLLHAGAGSLGSLLLVSGVIAAVLHFYAAQAVWAEQRQQALLAHRETSEGKPRATEPEKEAAEEPRPPAIQLPSGLPGDDD
jgi:tetratricopeptide (TPR) repeat protein